MDKNNFKNVIKGIESKRNDSTHNKNLTTFDFGIATDGILNHELYEKSLKILVLAKEPRKEENLNLDFDFSENIEDIVKVNAKKTWTRIYIMLKAVYRNAESNNIFDTNGKFDLNNKLKTIKTLAWVNVKKTFGKAKTNNKEFEMYVSDEEYCKLLKEQIESINPNYIIACGKAKKWLMTYLMVNIFQMNRDVMYRGIPNKYPLEKGSIGYIYINDRKVPVIATTHFSRNQKAAIDNLVENFNTANVSATKEITV